MFKDDFTWDTRNYEYYKDSKVNAVREYRGVLNNTDDYIKKLYDHDVFDRVTKMPYVDSNSLSIILEQYMYSYDKDSNIISEKYHK